MDSTSQTPLPEMPSWQEECARLFAKPISVRENLNREGKTLGLRVQSSWRPGQTLVNLLISLFPLHLSDSTTEERESDQTALGVFLEGVRSPDFHIRLAACETLGQLGHTAARQALQTAAHDENRLVRDAATRALIAVDMPRLQTSALAGVRLLLWRQVKHLWRPMREALTDAHGRARFPRIPEDATCRLQLPGQVRHEETPRTGCLTVDETTPEELAAAGDGSKSSSLPQSQRLALEDGSLLCTIYRNDQEQVVLEFRSDARQLQDRGVYFVISNNKTHKMLIEEIVHLEPDTRGVLTGQFVLETISEFSQEHEIRFGPLIEM